MESTTIRALGRMCFFACAALASQSAFSGPNEDLLAAASKGELPKLQRAMESGADTDARDEKKMTALMLASGRGHVDIVRALLLAGAKADATRDGGFAAIHSACVAGQLEIVKELLAAGASVGTATDKGTTPLLLAGRSGKVELMRFLVEAGADKNAVDANGTSVLMNSAQAGCVECMEFIRTPDTNFKAATLRGFTVLDYALSSHKWPAIQYVFDAGGTLGDAGKKDALFALIATPADQLSNEPPADAKLIRAAIAAGAALEGTNEDGLTPLLAAIKGVHIDALDALLEAKANIGAVDKRGDGALAIAAQHDAIENLQWLAAMSKYTGGSRKEVFKPVGRSDVWPATARRLAIGRRLIAAGAGVKSANKTGYTPIHHAAQLGDVEFIELLLGSGADVNAVDSSNTTPLMVAATWNFDEILRTLLAAGADKKITNKKGATALSIARETKNASAIAILEGKAVK